MPTASCCPASVRSGRAWTRCATPVWRTARSTRSRSGRPFLGICVGMQMLFDASEEDARGHRARRDPGHDPLDPGRRPAAADAVEPAGRSRSPTTRCSPDLRTSAVGLLRALAARRARRSRRRRRDVRVRRRRSTPRSDAATCSPRSSTRRSRATAGLRLLGQLRRHLLGGRRSVMVELYPGDRPARRAGRAPAQGDYGDADGLRRRPRRGRPCVRRRRRGVDPRRRPRRGAVRVSPINRPVVAAIAAAARRARRVQTGGGVRTVADAAGAGRRRRGPRRDGLGGRRAIPRWSTTPPPIVPRRRRARPPRRRARRPRLDRRARACRSTRRSAGSRRRAAFVITDIARDGMLDGPDVDGLAAVAAGATASR